MPAQDVAATPSETVEEKAQRLTTAVAQAQTQIEANQKLLIELKHQLEELEQQIARDKPSSLPTTNSAASPGSELAGGDSSTKPLVNPNETLDEIKERQAIEESQIATHDLIKVESESKYPLTLSGLILFNAFVNTHAVDVAASPSYAIPGTGSTGLSVRQTVLGLDARGPHLFGATSHADVRVDFFASGSTDSYTAGGVLRLRTGHAVLRWTNSEAFVELDRSLLEPNTPSSLLAVGQPELAWAGNLWTWNPQTGVSHQFAPTRSLRLKTQAALIDVADARLPEANSSASTLSQTERSRWPGVEGRIALSMGTEGRGPELGIGGYLSPHRTLDQVSYKAWAGTIDLRLPLMKHIEILANTYRGQGLGGLGGGGYLDYVYQYRYHGMVEITHPLNDVGGWAQLQAKAGQRWEFNTGYGIDNPFAKQVEGSVPPVADTPYPGLARNRAYYGNVIYSPSKYLLFSTEYRRLWTNFATGHTHISDVIGLGAGYRF